MTMPKKGAKRATSVRQTAAQTGNQPSTRQIAAMVALFNAGRNEEVAALAKSFTEFHPQQGFGWKLLGAVLSRMGRHADALAPLQKAAALSPNDIEAHCNLALTLHDLGQLTEAEASCRRALEIDSYHAEANFNLGNTLKKSGRLPEAEACYRRALETMPEHVMAHYNLGNTVRAMQRPSDAEMSYRAALKVDPDFTEARCNLGIALQDLGRFEEAEASYRLADVNKPDFAEIHCNWGAALLALDRLGEAEFHYRRALRINLELPEAHNNLGAVFKDMGQSDAAESCYRRALSLQPDYVDPLNNLGNALKDGGHLPAAETCYRRALAINPSFLEAQSNLLFVLNYSARNVLTCYLDEARQYGEKVRKKVRSRFSEWSCTNQPANLRVGLVSGDFRTHPVGYFLESLMARINPASLELIAYPTYLKHDAVTARLKPHFVAWNPLVGLSDEAATSQIHGDGVHVLLDLSGHSRHNRLPVFAWKPAPVQASWLGYFATTGVTEIDYFIGDRFVAPPDEGRHFTETLWRLPDYYMCITEPDIALDVGSLPALATGRITFGCFNNLAKMNDAVVRVWAKILAAINGSSLLLKTGQLIEATVREATLHRFAELGIHADRLLLEGPSPRAEYLAAYGRVDIALDPFPYPGGTTSIEGLWMGVPVLTRQGDRFLSRQGASIAHNAGLSNWVAKDEHDYVEKAIAFASDLEGLSRLRVALRKQVLASPLFDADRFARNFEEALWGMWRSRRERQVF